MFFDEDETDLSNAILFADGNRGIYIPQYFAESVIRSIVSNVSDEQWKTLESGPDTEWYWETWNDVCDMATIKLPNGETGRLYQDGDLWIIPNA